LKKTSQGIGTVLMERTSLEDKEDPESVPAGVDKGTVTGFEILDRGGRTISNRRGEQ